MFQGNKGDVYVVPKQVALTIKRTTIPTRHRVYGIWRSPVSFIESGMRFGRRLPTLQQRQRFTYNPVTDL